MRINPFSSLKHLIPSTLVTTCLGDDNIVPKESVERIEVYPLDKSILSSIRPEEFDTLKNKKTNIRLITSQIPTCANATKILIEKLFASGERNLDITIIAHPKDEYIKKIAEEFSIRITSFGSISKNISRSDIFMGSGTQLLVELLMRGHHVIIVEEVGGWPMVPKTFLDFIKHLKCTKLDISPYLVKTLPKSQEELGRLCAIYARKHKLQAKEYQKELERFKSVLKVGRKDHLDIFRRIARQ